MSCEWLSDTSVCNRAPNVSSVLAFLFASGPVDQAWNWQELTASQRTTYIQEYEAAGISLVVSAFGSTETPTTSGVDAVTAANTMAAWVVQYGVNGIDVDYEVRSLSTIRGSNQLINIYVDHRTPRHLIAALLNPGSPVLPSSSVQSFPKDSIFSAMPVSCLSHVECVMVVHQISCSPRAMVSTLAGLSRSARSPNCEQGSLQPSGVAEATSLLIRV